MLISETKYEPANLLFVDLFSEYIVRYLCAKIKFLFYAKGKMQKFYCYEFYK